jgi:hypothetical protein
MKARLDDYKQSEAVATAQQRQSDRLRVRIKQELKDLLGKSVASQNAVLVLIKLGALGGVQHHRLESHQVQQALKRAKVRFHPDKVPADRLEDKIRAEETFKILNSLQVTG